MAALNVFALCLALSIPPDSTAAAIADRPLLQMAQVARVAAQQLTHHVSHQATQILFFDAAGGASPLPGHNTMPQLPQLAIAY